MNDETFWDLKMKTRTLGTANVLWSQIVANPYSFSSEASQSCSNDVKLSSLTMSKQLFDKIRELEVTMALIGEYPTDGQYRYDRKNKKRGIMSYGKFYMLPMFDYIQESSNGDLLKIAFEVNPDQSIKYPVRAYCSNVSDRNISIINETFFILWLDKVIKSL